MSTPQESDSSRVRRSLLQRSAVLTAAIACGAIVVPASPLSSTGEMADRTVNVLKTVHLLTFASWFGTVVWVTFIAGIVMFRNMSREDFGRLQSRLFPRYFQFQTFLSSVAIVTYYLFAKPASALSDLPTLVLLLGLLSVLVNLVAIEPLATKAMFKIHKMRREEGNPPKGKGSDELKAAGKRFGMLHGISSLANLLALGAAGFHVHYLSTKLTF